MEVEDDVRKIWQAEELGNDNYIFKTTLAHLRNYESSYYESDGNGNYDDITESIGLPYLIKYLEDRNLKEDEEIAIHWWW